MCFGADACELGIAARFVIDNDRTLSSCVRWRGVGKHSIACVTAGNGVNNVGSPELRSEVEEISLSSDTEIKERYTHYEAGLIA